MIRNIYNPKPYVELIHPQWSKNATIYQVNLRQYTKEGTFKAFEKHLPRLKNLGIDILWLMPVHPIGEVNRKGTLGSYYSVKDYYGINPEFGTLGDLKDLVIKIHKMGMYVILDWVANHSAWDNSLTIKHSEWYSISHGNSFQSTPWHDWDDTIDFNFDHPSLREYMTKALVYWVKETNIDGYRCDVAGFVPIDFWENVRIELNKIKPVFMLAEWESRDLHKKAFDMTYAWTLWDKIVEATNEGKGISGLIEYIANDVNAFPKDAIRMNFTDNHDKNSWEGNQFTYFGDGLELAIVLTSLMSGMPLIYGGQEAGLDHSLKFFDKDLIIWKEHSNYQLFKALFELKHKNKALWNGKWGGKMVRIPNNQPDKVLSFYREKNNDKVLAIINFSNSILKVELNTKRQKGNYTELFTNKKVVLKSNHSFSVKPWGYLVLFN